MGEEGRVLSVAGLVNLGNTCFLSSGLQALASCRSLLELLEESIRVLPASDPRSLALAPALLQCLTALQPQPTKPAICCVAPRALLHTLLSRLPDGMLKAGEEHDAAEAVELLLELTAQELRAALLSRTEQQRQAAAASWAAVIGKPSKEGDTMEGVRFPAAGCSPAAIASCHSSTSCTTSGHACSPAAMQGSDGTCSCGDGGSSASSCKNRGQASKNPRSRSCMEQAASQHRGPPLASHLSPDPVLHAWRRHAWLPLRGINAHELQCLVCRHRSLVQLSPFWVLPLGVAVAPTATLLGNVPAAADASLHGCLANFYGYEAVQSWHCTRCSLIASLQAGISGTTAAAEGAAAADITAAGADQQQAAGYSADESQQGQEAARDSPPARSAASSLPLQLQKLHSALTNGCQIAESEVYADMLAAAGLHWHPIPCLAAKRTVAAQLPRVLCLQLRRGFWSAHGHHVKVTGHVAFPLQLPLPQHLVPLVGHGWASARGTEGTQLPTLPLYQLRAVVVHVGGLAAAGHYTVFRRLDTTCSSGCSGGSSGGRNGRDGSQDGQWVSASDEAVRPASVQEVLSAEASLLLYER